MRQRTRVEIGIALVEHVDVGVIAMAHEQQIAVAQHRALGSAGRAARIEQPCLVACALSTGLIGAPASAVQRTRWCESKSLKITLRPSASRAERSCARPGVATSNRAPQSPAMCSTSRTCSRALTGTAQSPAVQQANIISRNSAQFSMQRMTRSPGSSRSPRARPRDKRCGRRIRDSSRRDTIGDRRRLGLAAGDIEQQRREIHRDPRLRNAMILEPGQHFRPAVLGGFGTVARPVVGIEAVRGIGIDLEFAGLARRLTSGLASSRWSFAECSDPAPP